VPNLKLTDTEVKKLPTPETGQVLYWDEKLKGFGVRTTPTAKAFIVQGRVRGQTGVCRVKIGSVDQWKSEAARERAKECLRQMDSGINPNEALQAHKLKRRTLTTILDEYIERKKSLRPATEYIYRAAFRLGLSDWGAKTLDQISRDDVENRYDKLCNGWRAVEASHTRGKGEAIASQTMRLLGQLYNFEIEVNDQQLINPVKRLSHVKRGWSKSNQRQTVVLDGELPAFYKAVSSLRFEATRDYIMLVLLTGLRAQEAAGLRWDEIDLTAGQMIIAGSRTKNGLDHGLPLTPFTKAMLTRRDEQNNGKSEFVFPGDGKTGHFTEPKTAFAYVSEEVKKHITPHTLRHTFATVSQKLLVHPRLQSKLLNHAKTDITDRYVHADIDLLREPLQKINEHFLTLMGVPQPEPQVFLSLVKTATKKSSKNA
jgi:integrase